MAFANVRKRVSIADFAFRQNLEAARRLLFRQIVAFGQRRLGQDGAVWPKIATGLASPKKKAAP
jgi:hypothetical protein